MSPSAESPLLQRHGNDKHARGGSPLAKKIDLLLKEKGPAAPETQAAIQRILLVARFDIAILLLVVADMVTKPFS